MKYLLSAIVFCFALNLSAQVINFTDPNFKAVLVNDPLINTDADGEISQQEAFAYTGELLIDNLNLINLEGIEFFKNISRLNCNSNALEYIGLSNFPNLELLNCRSNQIDSIDLDSLPSLTYLSVSSNNLSSIDLDFNHSILQLFVEDNPITHLDLDLCGYSLISAGRSNLSAIDVTGCAVLKRLFLISNSISEIDVTQNTELTHLYIASNPISELDLSNNSKLEFLSMSTTGITEIDLLEKDSLKFFAALNVNISAIDFTTNHILSSLAFRTYEDIEMIDVSNNPLLTDLKLESATLNTIDVSNNLHLETIDLANNQLTNVDLSANFNLESIRVRNNSELRYVNIANGRNDSIRSFDAGLNPELFCIQVDSMLDTLNLPMDWTKDAQAEYNGICEFEKPSFQNLTTTDACSGATENGKIVVAGMDGFPPYTYRIRALNSFYDSTSIVGVFDSLKFGDYEVFVFDAIGNKDSLEILVDKRFTLKHNGTLNFQFGTATYFVEFCPEDNPTPLRVEGWLAEDFDFIWPSGATTYRDTFDLDTISYKIFLTNNANLQCEIDFKGVKDDNCISDVDDLSQKNELKIYPNPTSGALVIETDLAIDQIKIFSTQGQLIKSFTNEQRTYLDVSSLEEGVYIIQLISGSQMFTRKILKH